MLISKNQAVKRCQTLLVLMVSGLKAFYPGGSASPGKIHLSQFQGCYCDTSLLHPQVERTEQSTEACHFHLLQKFRSKKRNLVPPLSQYYYLEDILLILYKTLN